MRFQHTHRPGFWLGFIDFFTAGLFFLLYMPLGGLQEELDEILGRRTQRYWVAYLLGIPTAFIYPLIWMSRIAEELKDKAIEMGIDGPYTSWWHMFGWNVFGILLMGPAVATQRFFDTLNKIESKLNSEWIADADNMLAGHRTDDITIRDARPDDAPFLAKCIMAGMHFYDFETDVPNDSDIYERLIECERREDLLYSYRYTRVAEMNGIPVGSLLSYPGEIYREMRHKTFHDLWPDMAQMDAESEMETGPGEYYLDSLAVIPSCRHHGIGKALLQDGIRKGESLGYDRIVLVVDNEMPNLVRLYESIGFVQADHRHVFGVDFLRMVYIIAETQLMPC